VKQRRGRPLRTYIAALLVLIVAASTATTAYGFARAQEGAVRAAEQDAAFGASLGASDLSDSVALLRSFIASTAANPAVPGIFDASVACNLSFGTVGLFAKAHLDLIRPDGSVRCSSDQSSAAVTFAGAAWLPAALSGGVLVGPFVDARTGRSAVVAASPVGGRGIVAGFVDVSDLASTFALRYAGPRQLSFAVSRADGTVVSGQAAGAGADPVAAEAAVSGTDWTVRTQARRSTVLRSAFDIFVQQGAATLVELLVILLATTVVYRAIAYPMWRLDQEIGRRSAPADATALTEQGPREVRDVARSFNALIGALHDELAQRRRSEEEAIRLEHQLAQSQRLEGLGQLAGGVAHDFNNLLAVILNYTEFVRDALPDDSAVREDLEEIRRAAERAAGLTRRLLIFARREDTKPEVLDLNGVVAGLEALLRRTIGEHIELVTVLAPDLPSVAADHGQLDQVLINLAINARDAMPAGGRIVIETAQAVVDEEYARSEPHVVPGRYVRITVSDTGEGMSPEVAARALEPFFTTKPPGQGTGLGLATVYGIVTKAGGNVRIYSEQGHGTLVAVQLPVVEGIVGVEPEPADEMAPRPRPSGRILLVEDEPAVLLAAVRILSGAGYTVDAASDPSSAIGTLDDASKGIDLLLTDLVMPGLSGLELAEHARRVRPGLPVVFMTGYSREFVNRQGAVPEERPVLQKPFTRALLLDAVRGAIAATAVA
jgi:signal transduction histidine kinase/CheY-like chemotaxis protein